MRLGKIQYLGPLPGDQEQVNRHKIMKDPPCGEILHRFDRLVGIRCLMILQSLSDAVLQRCIYGQAHRHQHQQRHDPLGCFEILRGGLQGLCKGCEGLLGLCFTGEGGAAQLLRLSLLLHSAGASVCPLSAGLMGDDAPSRGAASVAPRLRRWRAGRESDSPLSAGT
jgi:hypothetical protein